MRDTDRVRSRPLFVCGFRPFFLGTAGFAVLAMTAWLVSLSGLIPTPKTAGSLVAWHAHEMIYGYAIASTAGFLLTAIPEFTDSAGFGSKSVVGLAALWLGERIAFWCSAWIGIWPAAFLSIGFIAWLLTLIAPRVRSDPARRHLSFMFALSALGVIEAGFFQAVAFDNNAAMHWLYAANDMLMILIVITISRISIRIVNNGIDGDSVSDVEYLARPPRRNLAIFAISLHAVAEFCLPGNAVTGWMSLAACAAMLNLLNDWHIGRALFRRWVLMLYTVYWMMAIGYGAMGVSLLGGSLPISAGRHLLMAGAMSLAILTVMCVAGRNHAGHRSEHRVWVPVAAIGLLAAALLRAFAGSPMAGIASGTLLMLSGVLWASCFALYLAYSWRILAGPRPDDAVGCAGPADTT